MGKSKLQKFVGDRLQEELLGVPFVENVRPDWMITPDGERCELDFYIESLDIAIEVQGSQHFVYTPHFHGAYDSFLKQKKRDKFKKIVCKKRKIKLYEVFSSQDIEGILEDIKLIFNTRNQKRSPRRSEQEISLLSRPPMPRAEKRKGVKQYSPAKNRQKGILCAGEKIAQYLDFPSVPDKEMTQLVEILTLASKNPTKDLYAFLVAYSAWIKLHGKSQKDCSQEVSDRIEVIEESLKERRYKVFAQVFGSKKTDKHWTPRKYKYRSFE